MADTPRQVNAAQFAARKIKAAKGVSARHGNAGLRKPGLTGSTTFGGQEASSGGLFGGGFAPPTAGSFDFNIPSSISFGNNSGNTTPFGGSDTEQDARADTTGEEAARRNKPFQIEFSQPQAVSQQSGNGPQRTPLSALGQPNGLPAAPEDGKSNLFQFGRSPSPATNVFSFGSTSAQQQQPLQQQPANPFSFSQPEQDARATSPFRFGTPPTQTQPASNPFPFAQNQNSAPTQPTSAGIKFGSTQVTQPPSSSIFSFGQSQSQPQPSISSNTFGPATVSAQPSSNIFGQSLAPASTPANSIFGQQKQQQPASTSNIFGQATQQPTTSNNPFGQSNPQPVATTNFFGQSNPQPASSDNIFTRSNQPKDSSSSISGSQSLQAATPTPTLFGEQKPASTNSLFGGNNQPNSQPTNIFGSVNGGSRASNGNNLFKSPIESSNKFGLSQPPNSLLGGQSTPATPNIFSNKAPTDTNNIFSNQSQSSSATANLFGHLNQPTPQITSFGTSEGPKNIFGASQTINDGTTDSVAINGPGLYKNGSANEIPPSPKPAPATLQSTPSSGSSSNKNPFQQSSFNNSLGATQQQDTILPSVENEGSAAKQNQHSGTTQPSTSNLFSFLKPAEAPEPISQPAQTSIFQSFPQSTSDQSTTNIFAANMARKSTSPPRTTSTQSTALLNGTTKGGIQGPPQIPDFRHEMREIPDSEIEPKCPTRFTAEQKNQFLEAYRLRSLNKGIKNFINASPPSADLSLAFHHYLARRDEILGTTNPKRKSEEVDNQQNSPNKRSKTSEGSSMEQHVPRTSSPLKTQPVLNSDGQGRPTSPEKASRSLQPQKTSPNKSQQSVNSSTTPKAPPPPVSFFGQRSEAPPSPSPRGKRKAEVQITSDYPTEEEALEHQKTKAATPNGRSVTSSVFQSILEKPEPTPTTSGSPEKKALSPTKAPSPGKTRFNPFASLPMPPASPFNTTPAVTKSSLFSANPTIGVSATSANLFGSKTATQTSNVLALQPTDSTAARDSAKTSGASAQSFTTSTSSLFSPKPATSSTNLFAPEPASAAPPTNPFAPKSAPAASAFNPFGPKPSPSTTESAPPLSGKADSVKPPTFGAPVNFLAQFGQKSQKSMADAEADAMEKAKMEDMDSDEDEAEWEANYKAKREAEKKATAEIAKTKRATFVPGKGFTFGPAQSSDSDKAAPSSISGQGTAAPISTTNLFAPINRSDTTSPGAASSRGSSVFDGVTSGKPISFGTNNIFGHLSDVDSGADSGKGNEADDDTDGESTDSNVGEDDDKKDTTYDPSTEEASPGTPGTPAEETGSGIASAKKPTSSSIFGTSNNSGASTPGTPGGSLFDRITKDVNGNPIRQLPGENKENASPSGGSIFGGNTTSIFNFGKKSPGDQAKSPSDHTWKQDSPIKFGASTTAPPAVNVTAPTPTKANQFAGIFGSVAPKSGSSTPTSNPFQGFFGSTPKPASPAPTSGSQFTGIFGNVSTSKPASSLFASQTSEGNKPLSVGFNFGAGSTATSSLFPSAAGSTATSRATSPGATTDGESVADTSGDPDADHHEQINLTSGGPGEENEEKVHEVRAKALKYEIRDDSAKDDQPPKPEWVVKGLGVLRVLKHKDTGSSRILLRADPSGAIVMNKTILGNVTYESTGKTVKLLTAGESGKALETWLLQVKTAEAAKELANALEANKKKD